MRERLGLRPRPQTPKITMVKGCQSPTFPIRGTSTAFDRRRVGNGKRTSLIPTEWSRKPKRARQLGAKIVVASLHMGDPTVTISQYQRSVAERVTKSGQVDLIIGHNSHQVQPVEMINGGMGGLRSRELDQRPVR